jgi:hypothetical protein
MLSLLRATQNRNKIMSNALFRKHNNLMLYFNNNLYIMNIIAVLSSAKCFDGISRERGKPCNKSRAHGADPGSAGVPPATLLE